ncbi:dienelactone hydrolase family protein [Talaromyces stipitatus ATCC 10500]|uniref:Dienelactone hydrolase family protein n=1 Tax=Talaromyces stipitatus (strain ATCC 10500 / CBS 375.48 / QM 6759 / NRRL 1006) TaxID=441959 RepID=B8MG96_TALSN|nr:dienelactone hydrolase family protein [Talaromyces stipitatus ATCC 10500]EED16216.1 dienelactone hydrolase family protein [Talaromyces stipitatus ATCC 10500]
MASNPPGSCCYKGVKHEGQPVGSISTVKDFEVYTSYPADKSTDYAVLLLTDILGHKFQNLQLIADQFASNGYFVFMPDLFHGDPVALNPPEGFDLFKWLSGHPKETVEPIVEASITELREKYKVKKIAAVGYCFGAKYVVRHLHPQQNKIDVGFIAHPSFVEADELKAIGGALAIAAAETDTIFPTEKRHESEVILKDTKLPYQINLYSGVVHGFAVRCDLSDKVAKYAKENAFLQAVQWFETYLKE